MNGVVTNNTHRLYTTHPDRRANMQLGNIICVITLLLENHNAQRCGSDLALEDFIRQSQRSASDLALKDFGRSCRLPRYQQRQVV